MNGIYQTLNLFNLDKNKYVTNNYTNFSCGLKLRVHLKLSLYFFFGLMLCKSALFIENYFKRLHRLRRCFLFTLILGAPTEPATSNFDFLQTGCSSGAKNYFYLLNYFTIFISHICVHRVAIFLVWAKVSCSKLLPAVAVLTCTYKFS